MAQDGQEEGIQIMRNPCSQTSERFALPRSGLLLFSMLVL
jgi:hypothetical protein